MERLRSDKIRFFTHLRNHTLKAVSVASDSNIRIKAYLTLFGNVEPESDWLKALIYIDDHIKGILQIIFYF